MTDLGNQIIDFFSSSRAQDILRAIVLIVIGLLAAKLAGGMTRRLASKRFSTHHVIMLRRISYYLVLGLFVVSALHQMGFNLSVLLGAAGIFSVAIGFASQTSASNLISGLFLMAERPFSIGDVIIVNGTTGEVLAIDLLSVKLRTMDNLFVRIPNESLIKSEVTNLTRFPIRRLDIQLGVAYKEDIEQVREILNQVAHDNPLCLEEPKPLFIFLEFGDSAINLQFSVWSKRETFLDLRNSMFMDIKARFDAEGIEIPFPHLSLYTGSATQPFPVRQAQADQGDKPAA